MTRAARGVGQRPCRLPMSNAPSAPEDPPRRRRSVDVGVALRAFVDGAGDDADVIHTAASSTRQRWPTSTGSTPGHTNVVTAARQAGVRRVVHVSSNSPFGTNPIPPIASAPDEPYHPYLGYGRSKMQAEQRCSRPSSRSRCDHRQAAVVLRSVPATRQTTSSGWCARQVPCHRRWAPTAVDGVRRQPGRRRADSRAHRTGPRPGLLDRRRRALRSLRDRRHRAARPRR